MSDDRAAPPGFGKLLIALVGIPVALGLVTLIPAEESGRKVEATVVQRDTATTPEIAVRHVAGPQYLKAYLDAVGIWTVCDGDTVGVTRATRETEAGCTRRLERVLVEHAQGIKRCAPGLWAPGREQQRLASISLAVNIGVAGFCGSTAKRLLETGKIRAGCDAFRMWVKAGRPKRTLRGLVERRERERAICLKGILA